MDYDVIIIGSGFGGSVAALRLSQKGYRVGILEMGRRVTSADMQKASLSPLSLFWMPDLGMKGYFTQRFFKHVNIVGGVGVGGGSLVYAAVLLKPLPAFYQDPAWNGLGINWYDELKPHFQTASTMLGVIPCPTHHIQDEALRQTAENLGVEDTYGTGPLGIYFGDPEKETTDPYFEGDFPLLPLFASSMEFSGNCIPPARIPRRRAFRKVLRLY